MPLFACSCVLIAASRREPDAAIADEFRKSLLRWREASEELRATYERWRSCEPPQRTFQFEEYLAALDREELAARVHSQLAQELHASR